MNLGIIYVSYLREGGQVCKLFGIKGLRPKRRYGILLSVYSHSNQNGDLLLQYVFALVFVLVLLML
jgi:hypothetical protein